LNFLRKLFECSLLLFKRSYPLRESVSQWGQEIAGKRRSRSVIGGKKRGGSVIK
jgi:hypothetical protein